jgi:uncharacterized lipoprotein YddW (UPF0748 family)
MAKRNYRILACLLAFCIALSIAPRLQPGAATVKAQKSTELNAVWISFYEYSENGYTKAQFQAHIDKMFDNVVKMGMNAVIVHVRPFADAMYRSKYFPWSKFASGTQGKDPGYDPLALMVAAAHKRNLQIHAWINPYRITKDTTQVESLYKNNRAYIWRTDDNSANDRNVLTWGNQLFYNPSVTVVRNLIVNGVREIVTNYDVDGIHFDDYFYPSLGANYANVFDAPEYEKYKSSTLAAGNKPKDIVAWRKTQVNYLVSRVYKAIKDIKPNVQFGISPAGVIANLEAKSQYYVDLKTWFTKSGYIDYICPQIYFSLDHPTAAFDKILYQWIDYMGKSKVKLYVGLAIYKSGVKIALEPQWTTDPNLLKKEIDLCKSTGKVSGFAYYSYNDLVSARAKTQVDKIVPRK